MKGSHLLALLIFIVSFPLLTFSETAKSNVNASPTPAPSPETITYKDLLDLQEKKHSEELQLQKEIADRAIQVAGLQTQTFLVIIEAGAFLFVLVSGVVGWWMKRQFDRFHELNKESEEVLSSIKIKLAEVEAAIKVKIAEVESAQSTFTLRIEEMTNSISPLEFKIQQFGLVVEKYHESIEDVRFKARLAEIGVRLRSDRPEERLIATQAASEIAQGSGGAAAIPLLLESLGAQGADPDIVAEALYGLTYRAKDLIGDSAAIGLILTASQSPEKKVRKQSLEAIRQIGLAETSLQERVKSCYESDDDDELRELAKQILSENFLLD